MLLVSLSPYCCLVVGSFNVESQWKRLWSMGLYKHEWSCLVCSAYILYAIHLADEVFNIPCSLSGVMSFLPRFVSRSGCCRKTFQLDFLLWPVMYEVVSLPVSAWKAGRVSSMSCPNWNFSTMECAGIYFLGFAVPDLSHRLAQCILWKCARRSTQSHHNVAQAQKPPVWCNIHSSIYYTNRVRRQNCPIFVAIATRVDLG